MAEWKIVDSQYTLEGGEPGRLTRLHWRCAEGEAAVYGSVPIPEGHPARDVPAVSLTEAQCLDWVSAALGAARVAEIEAQAAADAADRASPTHGTGRPWQAPTVADRITAKLQEIAEARHLHEGAGVAWTDAQGDTFLFDTSQSSQQRFAAARTASQTGDRTGTPVWKCAQLVDGNATLTFRPTSNAELGQVARLVHDHVQKCFDAEAAAAAKAAGGDFTADFITEFNALA